MKLPRIFLKSFFVDSTHMALYITQLVNVPRLKYFYYECPGRVHTSGIDPCGQSSCKTEYHYYQLAFY